MRTRAQHKNNAKKNFQTIKKKQRRTIQRKLLVQWMRALNNEGKIKVIQRLRNRFLYEKCFTILKLEPLQSKCINAHQSKRAYKYLKFYFKYLKNYSLKNKKLRIISTQIAQQRLSNDMARVLYGFRYQTLIMKNERLIMERKTQELRVRAVSGWKYQTVLNKTLRKFQSVKDKEELSLHFVQWFNLYKLQSMQRHYLQTLLSRKTNIDKFEFFTQWKRNAFKEKFVDLLQINFTQPHQESIALRCLKAWRSYSRVQRNKNVIFDHMAIVKDSFLARRVLRQWYEGSQGNMRGRILTKRVERPVMRLIYQKVMYLLSEFAHTKQIQDQNLEQFAFEKASSILLNYFNIWRKRVARRQLKQVLSQKRQIRLLNQVFESLRANIDLQRDKQRSAHIIGQRLQQIDLPTILSLQSKIQRHGIQLASKALQQQCFTRWLMFNLKMNDRKVKKAKAETFLRKSLFNKYFMKMLEAFDNTKQEEMENERAIGVRENYMRKMALKALAINLLKQRKYHQADMLYQCKLVEQALFQMKLYLEQRRMKSQLNYNMMHFLKQKCATLFKVTFTQWKNAYDFVRFQKQAVDEFDKFRERKLKQKAMDYFIAVVTQRKQIKEMTEKARQYFGRRNYLRTVNNVLFALKSNAKQKQNFSNKGYSKQIKVQIQDKELVALKFQAVKIQQRTLNKWKNEVKSTKNRQHRSKLYTVYSAWKFYTKEKTLLKKYLTECNGIDASMLSTKEMRENVMRVSAVKSNFCESLSSGTPFQSAKSQDRILNPLRNVTNQRLFSSNRNY